MDKEIWKTIKSTVLMKVLKELEFLLCCCKSKPAAQL